MLQAMWVEFHTLQLAPRANVNTLVHLAPLGADLYKLGSERREARRLHVRPRTVHKLGVIVAREREALLEGVE